MADEPDLAAKAHEAIRSGNLPSRRADRTFGGPGNGDACAVCREPVRSNQMELELEFNRHGARPGLDRYHLHPRCFTAWELERAKIEGTSP